MAEVTTDKLWIEVGLDTSPLKDGAKKSQDIVEDMTSQILSKGKATGESFEKDVGEAISNASRKSASSFKESFGDAIDSVSRATDGLKNKFEDLGGSGVSVNSSAESTGYSGNAESVLNGIFAILEEVLKILDKHAVRAWDVLAEKEEKNARQEEQRLHPIPKDPNKKTPEGSQEFLSKLPPEIKALLGGNGFGALEGILGKIFSPTGIFGAFLTSAFFGAEKNASTVAGNTVQDNDDAYKNRIDLKDYSAFKYLDSQIQGGGKKFTEILGEFATASKDKYAANNLMGTLGSAGFQNTAHLIELSSTSPQEFLKQFQEQAREILDGRRGDYQRAEFLKYFQTNAQRDTLLQDTSGDLENRLTNAYRHAETVTERRLKESEKLVEAEAKLSMAFDELKGSLADSVMPTFTKMETAVAEWVLKLARGEFKSPIEENEQGTPIDEEQIRNHAAFFDMTFEEAKAELLSKKKEESREPSNAPVKKSEEQSDGKDEVKLTKEEKKLAKNFSPDQTGLKDQTELKSSVAKTSESKAMQEAVGVAPVDPKLSDSDMKLALRLQEKADIRNLMKDFGAGTSTKFRYEEYKERHQDSGISLKDWKNASDTIKNAPVDFNALLSLDALVKSTETAKENTATQQNKTQVARQVQKVDVGVNVNVDGAVDVERLAQTVAQTVQSPQTTSFLERVIAQRLAVLTSEGMEVY